MAPRPSRKPQDGRGAESRPPALLAALRAVAFTFGGWRMVDPWPDKPPTKRPALAFALGPAPQPATRSRRRSGQPCGGVGAVFGNPAAYAELPQ